jgi:hypothetical protein
LAQVALLLLLDQTPSLTLQLLPVEEQVVASMVME